MNSAQKYFQDHEEVNYIQRDSIVEKVKAHYDSRSQKGIKEYGKTLDRKDFDLMRWLNELQTELMDATLYIEKLKEEIK